jgi:uncharacterized membrane protein HdeD (DUF308 family)
MTDVVSPDSTDVSGMARDVAKVAWWVVLIQGIAAMILGLFFLFQPGMTSIVLIQFVGIWWLFTGVLAIIQLFRDRTQWGWKLAMGIIGILAGITVLSQPIFSTVLIGTFYVFVIGIQGLFIGGLDLYRAFNGGGWGAGAMGVLSLIFGLLLISSPLSAALLLPFLFGGLALIFGGISIWGAFQLRKVAEAL